MYSYQKYQSSESTKIMQASPERLVAMLLEGVLLQAKVARERFQAGQLAGWKESINRAMRIVNYLSESLNLEQGGEIAKNLEQLYFFAISQLFEANRSDNPIPFIERVERVMERIHRSWEQATSGK